MSHRNGSWNRALWLLLPLLLLAAGCPLFSEDEDDDDDPPPPSATIPVPLDVKWSVKDDASGPQMTSFAARIQAASAALWEASEGQIYLRNVQLIDKDDTGQVILDNLTQPDGTLAFAYTYQMSPSGWEIHMGGAYPMQAWIHEIGHGELLQDWSAQEEYDLPGLDCDCAMEAYVTGSGEGKVLYCHSGNCTHTARNGCWQAFILPMHTGWTYPRTHGAAPTCTVTITNQ
ncbi:MAG: hypothetical protein MUC63_09400 [Planctomycetes bacterium]|nr:hypothetical protein [Planctomycetota bacterium]